VLRLLGWLYVYTVQQRPEGKHGCLCTMSGNVKSVRMVACVHCSAETRG
jgi:hypothetical protein